MQITLASTPTTPTQFRRLFDALTSHRVRRPLRRVRLRALSLALAGATGLCLIAGSLSGAYGSLTPASLSASPAMPAQAAAPAVSPAAVSLDALYAAASPLRYVRGYSVQAGWLCYGWSDGRWRCTQHWYRSATSGALISTNPGWVPNGLSGVTSSAQAQAQAQPLTSETSYGAAPPAPQGISQWAYTGRAAYPEPRGTFQGYPWGWCTSGAALLADDYVGGLGNAADWTRNAAARGMATGYSPRAGATVVFAPGVQGASAGGHVAHVLAVYSGGWFLVLESNFAWNGGGWGRMSYRYAHTGSGVTFVY